MHKHALNLDAVSFHAINKNAFDISAAHVRLDNDAFLHIRPEWHADIDAHRYQ
jgi:hypothetical protein